MLRRPLGLARNQRATASLLHPDLLRGKGEAPVLVRPPPPLEPSRHRKSIPVADLLSDSQLPPCFSSLLFSFDASHCTHWLQNRHTHTRVFFNRRLTQCRYNSMNIKVTFNLVLYTQGNDNSFLRG